MRYAIVKKISGVDFNVVGEWERKAKYDDSFFFRTLWSAVLESFYKRLK